MTYPHLVFLYALTLMTLGLNPCPSTILKRSVKKFAVKFSVLIGSLLGLPLLGIVLAGLPVVRYLEFPPEKLYVHPAPFSWLFFTICALFIFAVLFPLIVAAIFNIRNFEVDYPTHFPFPWWGWLGLSTGALFWILAWSRFSWFSKFQPHTFMPLWFSFILIVNGLCYRQNGHCMMRDRTRFFLLLFPLSAGFWWFFEYLNRFVQNWHYLGIHHSPWEYFGYATLSFSTVLAAVLGTRDWFINVPWMKREFGEFVAVRCVHHRILAVFALMFSAVGLVGVGVWPNYLSPLLWLSPLLIIVAFQELQGENHVLSNIYYGDWRQVISSALAAIFCGWFWEMWNYYSLAKWEYRVPFVHRFQIFEMPLLGYAGYLPFGLACSAVGEILEKMIYGKRTERFIS